MLRSIIQELTVGLLTHSTLPVVKLLELATVLEAQRH